MTDKNETENLDLNADQQRVAEALVFSGVNYERARLVSILEPHRGKAINVDTMLDIVNNIPPQQQEASEEAPAEESAE